MKRLLIAGVITVAVAAVSGPVAAAPPGLDGGPPSGLLNREDPYVCDGEETFVYGGSGRSGWLGGELYQAATVEAYDDGSLVFSKTWGRGPMSDDTVECTATDGAFSVTVTAVKVPGG